MNNIMLDSERPIIIYGPQGAGKTLLAQHIARQAARSSQMSAYGLFQKPFGAYGALREEPEVVIVESCRETAHVVSVLDAACYDTMQVRRAGSATVDIPTPSFIVCWDGTERPSLSDGEAARVQWVRAEGIQSGSINFVVEAPGCLPLTIAEVPK